MIRVVLTAVVSLTLAGGSALAANSNPNKPQIQALKEEISQLRSQKTRELKAVDEHFKGLIDKKLKPEDHLKRERAKVNLEEKEAQKQLNAKYRYIIDHLDLEKIRGQLRQALQTLQSTQTLLKEAESDYGGHKGAAMRSVGAAEHQLREALNHDYFKHRAKAGEDLHRAIEDLERALDYSRNHDYNGDPVKAEAQAVSDNELGEAIPILKNAHHLIYYIDHEVTDREQEKAALHQKYEAEKKKLHEEFEERIKQLTAEIHAEGTSVEDFKEKRDEEKKQITRDIDAKIKVLQGQIKSLEKEKAGKKR